MFYCFIFGSVFALPLISYIMDPVTGAALITAGSTIGSSIINHIWGDDGIDMEDAGHLMQMQELSTQNIMGYQDMLNNFNTIREREYNTPLNQVERLRAAGLNPVGRNLDGSGASTPAVGLGASGDAAASYSAAANAKMQRKQFSLELMNLAAQTAKTVAETKNIQEDTRQKGVVTEGLQIDNKYKAGNYELDVQIKGWTIKGQIDAHNMSVKQQKQVDESTKQIAKQTESLDQQIKESMTRVGKIESETEFQKLVNKFYPAETRAKIRQMASQSKVNEETAKQMETLLPYMVSKYAIENGLLAFDFEKSSVIKGYTENWKTYGENEHAKLDAEHAEYRVREKTADLDFGHLTNYGDYHTTAKFVENAIGALGTPIRWFLKQ